MAGGAKTEEPRKRVPAAERRDALIEAAMHEFAHGGLHGTKVSQVARAVGVAQPYVFSLFPTKVDLFLAAVERGFQRIEAIFRAGAEEFRREGPSAPGEDMLRTIGRRYVEALGEERDLLLLQLQAYAACGDDEIRDAVRGYWSKVGELARSLSGADEERLDHFFRGGMWLNVVAALGVEDLGEESDWLGELLEQGRD